MCGCKAKNVDICSDSEAEIVGWRVITVTVQPRAAMVAARRRNGIKMPVPEQGNRATWGDAISVLFFGGVLLMLYKDKATPVI